MRDYANETTSRVAFIKEAVAKAGVTGIVFGNSGGKDSALAGILCKLACDNTVGVSMPCGSKANYGSDLSDAKALATQFNIDLRVVDLAAVQGVLIETVGAHTQFAQMAIANIAPRLRMTTLYAIANSENRLVVGTDNRSEMYMGYFTKWGDGAYDINPVGDLTVTEVYEFLAYLGAPESIISKAPSAGLFEGQTDEKEMGVTYSSIDKYLAGGEVSPDDKEIIERFHRTSEHKRKMPPVYNG